MESISSNGMSRLREPGLWRNNPHLERYVVPGGGAIILELHPGDELTVIDVEGCQIGELVPFDYNGNSDPGALTERSTYPAQGFQEILGANKDDRFSLMSKLRSWDYDLEAARAIRLFSRDSSSGEQDSFISQRGVRCVICAPGSAMAVDEQTPPTSLLAWVRRTVRSEIVEPALPEPLAEPRLDFRISKCMARDYEVRAGEYVQIIDVAGRECSDFMVFDQRRLDEGIERGFDTTATRSLMGTAYPGPGLFSKYYDQDMQPLMEVVRDTVGRHDTFAFACTSKYYEDMGYFGHANCSDNLSSVLKDYGVAPRPGWPAVNLFYNTRIDEDNVVYFDEPWSRSGDYVLLRAFTDLVCATTACPDDTSAANGWNPTDIHVRVYRREETFSRATYYRMTTDSEPRLTEETGFHNRTSKLTRHFNEYRGYWLPACFTSKGAIDEYWACREKAVIIDLSPLRKFEIFGPDSESLVQHILTRNCRKVSIGQVVYSAMCYPHGGMLDDGTLFRINDNNFRWIGGSDYGGIWMREEAERLGYRVWIKSSTDQLHNVAVQGPKSRSIVQEVVWTPPSSPSIEELGWFRFTVGRIGDYNGLPVMVSRTGYTGELGYEIFCHPTNAPKVWDSLWEAGIPHGLSPMGLDALDMARIEAGLVFADYEFTDEIDPFEAGIGFTVALKNEEEFVGRESLLRRKEHPQRKLVGLDLGGNEVGIHGDCVHVGKAEIGIVTSATRSPILKKNIALCRIDVTYSEIGTDVEIGKLDGHQKRIPATVVPFPHYDPKKERVRS